MYLRFLNRDAPALQPELANFAFIHDAGFKHHPNQPLRFDLAAVKEHFDLLVNHFSKALDNIAKKSPLPFERAWLTNDENPLILEAAERSERRLLAHVINYTEAKYGVHLQEQQQQLDHLLRNGNTIAGFKRAMEMFPLPYVDLAIFQYCHMLSSTNYLDDTARNINRLYGELRFEDPAPISDMPFLLTRMLQCYRGKTGTDQQPGKLEMLQQKYPTMPNLSPKLPEGPLKPKSFDFESLNGRYPSADYLHWPEGGPIGDQTCLLDEIPERMTCCRCERELYFTRDKGEAWFSILEGESVLCRYCGSSNSLLTLKWLYLRDDMIALHKAIQYFRNPQNENTLRTFPDMLGRHGLGPHYRRWAIDRVLRHSVDETEWEEINRILKQNTGEEEDWDELIEHLRFVDRYLPSTNLHPRVIETRCGSFWEDLINRYRKSLNRITTVDFTASLANLRNFVHDLKHLEEMSKGGDVEVQASHSRMPKALSRFRSLHRIEPPTASILPRGSSVKYEQFLRLKAKYPGHNLLPTIAIELLWRTHLLYPAYYHTWCIKNFGCWVEHNFDKVTDKSLTALEKRYLETANLWWAEYKEEYIESPTSWFHHFSTTDSYNEGWMPRDHRPCHMTAKERKTKQPYWAQDQADYTLSPSEQEELYHTLFPNSKVRLLIVTKLTLECLLSRRVSKSTMVTSDPKLAALDNYLKAHWDEQYNEYLSIIKKYPHLNHLVNNEVSSIVLAINLLFTYHTTPPTHISQIFQSRNPDSEDYLTVVTKRLLMWLCVRHSTLFNYRTYLVAQFFKNLHLRNIMRYRAEICPADLLSSRVINFLEKHYKETISTVVTICEPLFAPHIPTIEVISVTTAEAGSSRATITSPSPAKRDDARRGLRDVLGEQQTMISLGSSGYDRGGGGGAYVLIRRTGTWSTRDSRGGASERN
ncbi:hypothetical protein AA313_de0202881 [Arthrobotrys entomopaga]|nr:hypothetical protein AA313_de0202881 [Arthrobotrys entomopaga]